MTTLTLPLFLFFFLVLPLDLKKKQSISDKSVKISCEKSADLTYGTYNMYPSFLLINGQYIYVGSFW